jgi:hypothetical protein
MEKGERKNTVAGHNSAGVDLQSTPLNQGFEILFLFATHKDKKSVVSGARIANLHRQHGYIDRLWVAATFFIFLSLFVVTKSNQKRPDKKNSLRLRLRSNSFLSQWKEWVDASLKGSNIFCSPSDSGSLRSKN